MISMANKLREACSFNENFLGGANVPISNLHMVFHRLTNISTQELETKSIVTTHTVTNFISSASLCFLPFIIDV
jgi:hypothetical protein